MNNTLICPYCGSELEDDAKYCAKCGGNIDKFFEDDNDTPQGNSSSCDTTKELFICAIALVLIGIALYNFKIYYDTMYTFNMIDEDEAPRYMAFGITFLIPGLITGIKGIAALIKKLKM